MKRETLKLIRAFLAEFGMTPSSRTRIKVGPDVPDEEMERLLTLAR
jgi:AraC-like DNA-binding protein